MNRFALAVCAALSLSALAGCSSPEPTEPRTVHCMRCHRSVSSECVVCTDCAAPQATPVVENDTPLVADTTPRRNPPARVEPEPVPVAVPAGRVRTLFLNNFPQADSDAVEAELLSRPDFVDVTPGGGAAGRRVAIEFKYKGSNVKRDLVAIMRKLGYRFHFTEAKLPEQVELVKE
jgi:hypothetical protein